MATTTAVGAFSLDWKDKCQPQPARLPSYAASCPVRHNKHTTTHTQVTAADKELGHRMASEMVVDEVAQAKADALKQSKLRTTICKS